MPQTRHKSIDEKLESSEVESLGIDEQLEINISGRKFSISLKGFEPNAIVEIKELLETQSVDLLDLMRAYLNSVHSRCELESQVAHITQKIVQKLPQVFITKDFDEAQDGQADEEVDNELDEEDLADSSEFDDLAEEFGDDFEGFEEEFGHSGEVYGAFGEFNMLGGLGIHSKSEIEPSEEELDEIMAQKEQESQNQKAQNQELQDIEVQDKKYDIAEANEAVKTTKSAKTIEATKKEQKDEQVKQADDPTQTPQTPKEHTDKKPNYETTQSENSLENQPQNQSQNQLVQNQMLENQSLENHSQSLANQALQAPKAKFDQARFDFADFSKPNPNKNEAQNLETESKASDSKAHLKYDLDSKADIRTDLADSKADFEADLEAKSKVESKAKSSADTKESELSHAGQAHSTFANRGNNSFDFMADSPMLEPKPKSTLSRITKFFKNP